VEGKQRAVEPGIFMRLGDRLNIVAVDNRTAARDDLGGLVIADEADEFDGHGRSLLGEEVASLSRGRDRGRMSDAARYRLRLLQQVENRAGLLYGAPQFLDLRGRRGA
jgi:hypothetical protein